ncbi:UNVERIFIED_CONTAM: hypothetical protein Sradi_2768500 [Sesamum radiatum]|uniref:MADS-box domain-containing protein n=1 Tax=Sesamum radiatum TaxID=300843 RepID=A0AAW2S9Z0_SESRA
MGRAQLRLELISNEKARVAAFGKRKKSLEKAAHELSTLCGVDIGMVVYFPAQNNEANQPTIWPKDGHELLTSLIHSYKSRSGYDCRRRNSDGCIYGVESSELTNTGGSPSLRNTAPPNHRYHLDLNPGCLQWAVNVYPAALRVHRKNSQFSEGLQPPRDKNTMRQEQRRSSQSSRAIICFWSRRTRRSTIGARRYYMQRFGKGRSVTTWVHSFPLTPM